MSRSVDLFIDVDMSLEELAASIGSQFDTRLAEDSEHGRWVLEQGNVKAVLAEHPYVDDGDLLLSRYRFALSARVADTVRPQETAEAALLRRVGDKLQRGPGWPVLIVLDLQYRDDAGPQRGVTGVENGNGTGRSTGTSEVVG